jgi:hypothetical protein
MTCNIVSAWPYGIMGVSDRRLTGLVAGDIRTNRSTKITVFRCADAHGVIVYNGIGADENGLTPSQWLLDLSHREKLFDRPLSDVLGRVRIDLETRLRSLRVKYGSKAARHTFLFGVWQQGKSILHCLSNYEQLRDATELAEGTETVKESVWFSEPRARTRIVATGAHPSVANLRAIAEAIAKSTPDRVKARCVKAVRDIAYGRNGARGSVSATTQWVLMGPTPDQIWFGHDIAGGGFGQELPNLINIAATVPLGGTMIVRIGGGTGMEIKDAHVEIGTASRVSRYDPVKQQAIFDERKCGICGTPWPASHAFCEVCMYDDQHRLDEPSE